MFRNFRFRLTLLFVCLSTLAYLVTTIATGVLFHTQLTAAIDNELTELIAENIQNLDYGKGRLSYNSTPHTLSTRPIKMLASIQLFDSNERLVHEAGAPGLARLFHNTVELPVQKHHLRSKSRRLFDNGKPVGFLQVQLPTDQREKAENERAFLILLTTPVLLFLLSIAGYYFTALTTKPIEQTFTILRDFMINAGHELNTPLSIAQSVLENLDRYDSDLQNLSKKLPVIKLSITRMRNLVDDLILLAKLDSDKVMQQTFEPSAFHDLVTESVEHIYPLLESKNISLQIASIAKVWVRGNPLHLQQMLTNLLQNAISYNKPEGTVTVHLSTSDNKAILCISDTGLGISKEDLPRVFERFFRVESSRSRETGGSGLGLSIVKAIVDSHHGNIRLESELNAGTQVTITFPALPPPPT